jgi:AcrR family transcriptional regulator
LLVDAAQRKVSDEYVSEGLMPKKNSETTRERILEAAECIYAAQGFHGMSLRDVTLMANVNLAAVNYHFGSKDKLVLALAERRLTPINSHRIQRLADLRKKHGRQPIPASDLVTALVDPVFVALRQNKKSRTILVRLVAQMLIDDHKRFSQIHQIFYKDVIECYHEELKRSLPKLSTQQIHARFFCAFSSVLGLRLMANCMDWFMQSSASSRQFDLLEKEITSYLIGGLSA